MFSEVAKAWSCLGDYNRALDAGELILANAEKLDMPLIDADKRNRIEKYWKTTVKKYADRQSLSAFHL